MNFDKLNIIIDGDISSKIVSSPSSKPIKSIFKKSKV